MPSFARLRCAVLAAAVAMALVSFSCSRQGPPAPAAPPLSLIVVTVDTLRADHGDERRMPALHRLRQQAIGFDQAVSVGPVTLPAHASLLTGLYPPRHGVRDNTIFTLAPEVPSFTAALKARGFATAAFVSAMVLDARYGLDRGFDVYGDVDEAVQVERDAATTFNAARQWLSTVRQPFFLWVHLFEPHAPYTSGTYASEVAIVDREIDAFTRFLHERDLWDRIVFSVTADHGESLGEHGEQTHGFFLYDSTVRIPWVMRVPGRGAARVADQVRIIDVLPTMVDLAGQGALLGAGGELQAIDGVSLVPVIDRGQVPRLEAYTETFLPRHQFSWSQTQALRTEKAKYIEAPRPELYDLTADPLESRNVLAERADLATGMKRTLGALLRVASPSRRPASDPVMAERFMSLGYIGYAPASADTGATSPGLPDPKDKLPVYLEVMAALELAGRGNKAAALARLDVALAKDPDVVQAHFLKATWLGERGRHRDAVGSLERTLALNPRYVTARFKLALALLRLGNDRRADHELQEVLKDEPDNVRAWHNLAAIAYTRGDFARAEELERKAIAIDPSYAESWATLGAIHIVGERAADAIAALERATSLAPRNPQALVNLALAYEQAGRTTEAAAARQRACGIDPRRCH
jgi:arylsulfatase A-like enzyme/Tfp pilus assembly protein PilF